MNLWKNLPQEYFPKLTFKSLLDIPIYMGGELEKQYFVMGRATHELGYWTNEDINFSKLLPEIIALAIETTKEKNAENQIIYKMKF